MKRPVAGCILIALVGGAAVNEAPAQPVAHESRSPSARASGLVSIPVSRRTTVRRIPYGSATVVDEISRSVVPYNWQGFYLGLHGGGAWGRTRADNTSPFGGYDTGTALGYTVNPSAVLAGGQFGYLGQSGNWVYGGEVDLGYLVLDRSITVGDDRTAAKYSWYGTFTGRVGFAWDHTLYYLKAGGALARIRNTASDLDGTPLTIDPSDFSEAVGTRVGWTIGAGVEYGLTANWSAKIEYLYMDFGRVSSTNLDGETFRHDNSVHTVKLGVNYRFGGEPLFIRW